MALQVRAIQENCSQTLAFCTDESLELFAHVQSTCIKPKNCLFRADNDHQFFTEDQKKTLLKIVPLFDVVVKPKQTCSFFHYIALIVLDIPGDQQQEAARDYLYHILVGSPEKTHGTLLCKMLKIPPEKRCEVLEFVAMGEGKDVCQMISFIGEFLEIYQEIFSILSSYSDAQRIPLTHYLLDICMNTEKVACLHSYLSSVSVKKRNLAFDGLLEVRKLAQKSRGCTQDLPLLLPRLSRFLQLLPEQETGNHKTIVRQFVRFLYRNTDQLKDGLCHTYILDKEVFYQDPYEGFMCVLESIAEFERNDLFSSLFELIERGSESRRDELTQHRFDIFHFLALFPPEHQVIATKIICKKGAQFWGGEFGVRAFLKALPLEKRAQGLLPLLIVFEKELVDLSSFQNTSECCVAEILEKICMQLGRRSHASHQGELFRQLLALHPNIRIATLDADRNVHHPDREYLERIREQEPTSEVLSQPADTRFRNADWNEVKEHVILVHALDHQSTFIHGLGNVSFCQDMGIEMSEVEVDKESVQVALSLGTFSPTGMMGAHINLSPEGSQPFTDRPTTHWCWNMLVQPHSAGSWEKAKIAVLEPMTAFEEVPYGTAPFDTFVVGPHKLSPKSVLLVPEELYDRACKYFKNFLGCILSYKDEPGKTLREHVAHVLDQKFQERWVMCDESGAPLTAIEKKTTEGYLPKTFIKDSKGKIIPLLQGSNLPISKAMYEAKLDAYLGLHAYSEIDRLERNPYFQQLKNISCKGKVSGKYFISNVDAGSLKDFGALICYETYLSLKKYDPKTGTHAIAELLLSRALKADILSLAKNKPLSDLELQILYNSLNQNIKNQIVEIRLFEQERWKNVQAYKKLIEQGLGDLLVAKCQADNFIQEAVRSHNGGKAEERSNKNHDIMTAFPEEWGRMEQSGCSWDLSQSYPLNPLEWNFYQKVKTLIPQDVELLKELIRDLHEAIEGQENFKLLGINSIIRWSLVESFFPRYEFLTKRPEILPTLRISSEVSIQNFRFAALFAGRGILAWDRPLESIVLQMKEPALNSRILRRDLAYFMERNRYLYEHSYFSLTQSSWEEHLRSIKEPGTYISETEIKALAHMLNQPIVLLSTTSKLSPIIYSEEAEGPPIFLVHLNQPLSGYDYAGLPLDGANSSEIFRVIKEEATRLWKEAVRSVVYSTSNMTADLLLNVLASSQKLKDYFSLGTGEKQFPTIFEHTKKVLEVAISNKEQFSKRVLPLEWNEFLLFLALHDIGKGLTVDEKIKKAHHSKSKKELELYLNTEIMAKVLNDLEVEKEKVEICRAMMMHDPLGEYLPCDLTLESAAEQVVEMSKACNLNSSLFFDLFKTFHLCDAGSYDNLRDCFLFDSEDRKGIHYCVAYSDLLEHLHNRVDSI